MEWLQQLVDNSNIPIITAFLLGLLTAVSPCPLATNITAIGFISKHIERRNIIFWNGILYTVGRIIAYSVLGMILIPLLQKGRDVFELQSFIAEYGEMVIGPVLFLIGLFMLFASYIRLPKFGLSADGTKMANKGSWGALLLGILFAMAFCPTSGIFYFGMLIPMATAEPLGYLYPAVYAFATGLPVILVAWTIAYSMAGLGKLYQRIQVFQKWLNIIVAVLFLAVGVYYMVSIWG